MFNCNLLCDPGFFLFLKLAATMSLAGFPFVFITWYRGREAVSMSFGWMPCYLCGLILALIVVLEIGSHLLELIIWFHFLLWGPN